MRQVRLLAVAPRPCDDELLSCWHWRVASHYSTSPPQVESWISGSPRGQNQDFFSRDFHPNQTAIRLWARACRIREGDLDRLSLRGARRPKTSFVSDPLDRGVCPLCLDEDAVEGRDHYCRRWWAGVEAVVCPRHGIGLENNCARCFRSGLFQFRQTPAGVVRLLCRYCGAVVSARGFQRRDQAEIAKVGEVIRDAIAKGGPELDLVTKASRSSGRRLRRSPLHHRAGSAATLWPTSVGIHGHCAADEPLTSMAGSDDCGDHRTALRASR
ncbi:TniQ family protein (plasmid) [Agrobacterium salinitolerans]|uniref:TniQ family protein n=1 Tax=Agrobacterium salinitolerans TaxID=1183413 RepID=UPI001C233405|nr:TniQ family protein [Agrobacterium salinitolerans]